MHSKEIDDGFDKSFSMHEHPKLKVNILSPASNISNSISPK